MRSVPVRAKCRLPRLMFLFARDWPFSILARSILITSADETRNAKVGNVTMRRLYSSKDSLVVELFVGVECVAFFYQHASPYGAGGSVLQTRRRTYKKTCGRSCGRTTLIIGSFFTGSQTVPRGSSPHCMRSIFSISNLR